MEVEPSHPPPEAWDDLLRRVKKQKTDESMDVTAVEFGIEEATGATGSQPVTVNLYVKTNPAGPLTFCRMLTSAGRIWACNTRSGSVTPLSACQHFSSSA